MSINPNSNYDFASVEELLSSNLTPEDLDELLSRKLITGTQYRKYASVIDPNYDW